MSSKAGDARALVRVLDSFTCPNGTPDISRRRDALRTLLEDLSFSDRRYLEDWLKASHGKQDFVSKLPIDLVLIVGDHLYGPSELLAASAVSRQWRQLWSDNRTIFAALSSHFPEAAELARINHNEATLAFYREHCRKTVRRQNGRYDSAIAGLWRYPHDKNFKLDRVIPSREIPPSDPKQEESPACSTSQYLYSDGRLAWPHKFHVIVDDLKNMKRVIYDIPPKYRLSGPKLNLEALGDELIITSINRNAILWNLKTDEMQIITLPANVACCYVGGNTVGILAMNWTIFVYEFGKSVQVLEVPKELAKSFGKSAHRANRERDIAIIIEPQLKNTLFLASVIKDKKETMTYTIAKFQNLKYVTKWERKSFKKTGGWCSLRCYKANNFGLYSILLESTDLFEKCDRFSHEYATADDYNQCWELLFDTKKEKFEALHYHVPFVDGAVTGLMDISDKFKTWGGRMIVSVEHSDAMTTFDDCENDLHPSLLVAGLPACEVDENTKPFRRIGEPLRPDPVEGNRSRHPLMCCWDACPDLDIEFLLEPWNTPLSMRFDGDDEFIVSVGTSGYAAWSFGHMMAIERSEEDLRRLYGMPRERLDGSVTDTDMEDGDPWYDEVDDMLDPFDNYGGWGDGLVGSIITESDGDENNEGTDNDNEMDYGFGEFEDDGESQSGDQNTSHEENSSHSL